MSSQARNPRFQKGQTESSKAFTASVSFDWRLLPYDIQGSKAHSAMLVHQGVISAEEGELIAQGLDQILARWQAGELEPRLDWEDVHMNVEGQLFAQIGPIAGKLHTARSRNDQVSLDMHLYMRAVGWDLTAKTLGLLSALIHRAENDFDVIVPGYTHLQAAQPVLLAHHWMAYVAMLERDLSRIDDWRERLDASPLGAGALAGTPYPTEPEYTAQLLGFSGVYHNSLDAVSDRDFLLEFLSWSAILGMHLSRLGEELVLWSSQEFGYVHMDDAYATGSSMMPQKKNPDVAELMRGKAGRLNGNLMTLLTVMKGLPLAYDSDMQEDKEAVFDTVDTLSGLLPVAQGMLETLSVDRRRIGARLGQDYTRATDIADLLVKQGMPFRQAYHQVGGVVGRLESTGRSFDAISDQELAEYLPGISRSDIEALSPDQLVKARGQSLGTAPDAVTGQIRAAKSRVHQRMEALASRP
ncbi:MAG: argininosuccinate lyase [Firmicutes bacterium]|nr:argininosuccinate lyase [Bacillota bacterium]